MAKKKKAAKKLMGLSEGIAALSADCGRGDDVNDPLAGFTPEEPGEERGVPTLEPPTAEEIAAEEPTPEIQTDDPSEELIPSDVVSIEVPLRGEYDPGLGHVDTQLNRQQASVMRRLQDGLDHGHARLASGKPVFTRADVVRWLLEKIGLGAK